MTRDAFYRKPNTKRKPRVGSPKETLAGRKNKGGNTFLPPARSVCGQALWILIAQVARLSPELSFSNCSSQVLGLE